MKVFEVCGETEEDFEGFDVVHSDGVHEGAVIDDALSEVGEEGVDGFAGDVAARNLDEPAYFSSGCLQSRNSSCNRLESAHAAKRHVMYRK